MIVLGLLITSTAWGVGSGHLPISPSANAEARVVSLYSDGEKKIISTDATTVGGVLQRAGVTLGQGDLVEPSASTSIPQGFFNINVYRAKPVTIIDGADTYHLSSAYSSPRLLAESVGIKTYPADQFKSEVVTNFVNQTDIGIKLTVERSLPFSVTIGNTKTHYRAQPGTVAKALASAGVPLGLQDTVSSPLDSPLTANMALTITRVSVVQTTVQVALSAPNQTVNDPSQPVGYSAVRTQGTSGHETVTYRIHYANGIETSRETLATTDVVAPTTTVTVVGTKVTFAGSVEYWRPMVTAAAGQYGIDANTMMRIRECESSGSARASNGTHFGLYQYLPSTWISAGGNSGNILDGAVQIQLTAKYMSIHGTGAWQCK
jgi:uncharacterized protein YabE (DUF348 family)